MSTAKKNNVNFCFTERVQTGSETYITGYTNYNFSSCISVTQQSATMGGTTYYIKNNQNFTVTCHLAGGVGTTGGTCQLGPQQGMTYSSTASYHNLFNPNEIVASMPNYGTRPVYGDVRRARLIKLSA